MSQRNSGYVRQEMEDYSTPPWVGAVIARWLQRQSVRSIWEPAPGRGQLGRALAAHGFSVHETDTDFFLFPQAMEVDALVTNPPYGKRGELAERFIRRALDMNVPIAAFLLRVDYDSAKTRADIFRDCPSFAGKIVLLDRIVWFEREGGKSPSENHAWFIWDRWNQPSRPGIAYGGKPDEDRPRKVDHADQGRDRDRRAHRRHAPSERPPRGG
jgi:hypothetical protein